MRSRSKLPRRRPSRPCNRSWRACNPRSRRRPAASIQAAALAMLQRCGWPRSITNVGKALPSGMAHVVPVSTRSPRWRRLARPPTSARSVSTACNGAAPASAAERLAASTGGATPSTSGASGLSPSNCGPLTGSAAMAGIATTLPNLAVRQHEGEQRDHERLCNCAAGEIRYADDVFSANVTPATARSRTSRTSSRGTQVKQKNLIGAGRGARVGALVHDAARRRVVRHRRPTRRPRPRRKRRRHCRQTFANSRPREAETKRHSKRSWRPRFRRRRPKPNFCGSSTRSRPRPAFSFSPSRRDRRHLRAG